MTLYQVKGTEIYGTKLATNSSGQFVLEMKGSGEVKAYPKEQLEEVLPFTVAVQFLHGTNNQKYHYLYDGPVKLRVGDLLFIESTTGSCFAKVTDVDTKSKKAMTVLTGFIVGSAPL